jgi:hypothetical protein
VLRKATQNAPGGKTLGNEIARCAPSLDPVFPIRRLVLDGDQLFVADQPLDVLDLRRRWTGRDRRLAASGLGQRNQTGQELSGAHRLLAALAGNAERLEQLADDQPIADRKRRVLDPEFGLCDLVLVELADCNRLAVERRRDVLEPMKRDQRCIDRVARPSERGAAESLANIGAGLAGANGGEDLLANGMLLGGVRVAGRLERMVGAIAGALNDGFPGRRIRVLEARELLSYRSRRSTMRCSPATSSTRV